VVVNDLKPGIFYEELFSLLEPCWNAEHSKPQSANRRTNRQLQFQKDLISLSFSKIVKKLQFADEIY